MCVLRVLFLPRGEKLVFIVANPDYLPTEDIEYEYARSFGSTAFESLVDTFVVGMCLVRYDLTHEAAAEGDIIMASLQR